MVTVTRLAEALMWNRDRTEKTLIGFEAYLVYFSQTHGLMPHAGLFFDFIQTFTLNYIPRVFVLSSLHVDI